MELNFFVYIWNSNNNIYYKLCEATQETPCLLWSQKVHYHALRNLPLVRIMSHINLVHSTSPCLFLSSILLLSYPYKSSMKMYQQIYVTKVSAWKGLNFCFLFSTFQLFSI
jgi:hypothetical protein